MKVTLTGGSGFIGTRLSDHFLSHDTEFENLDIRNSRSFAQYRRNVDIRNEQTLCNEVSGDVIIHLAAVHRDDVRPMSLYAETNVEGTRNICKAAEANGISKIIFTSSVAVYGFAPPDTGEEGTINPFNEYGRTKYDAELVLREWQQKDPKNRGLTIVRPTVVFGEGNRGNVYNLLCQLNSGKFAMVGNGKNRKSMAYVENIAAFLAHCLNNSAGVHVFNYVDKPDFTMNELVSLVRGVLKNKPNVGIRLPLPIGYAMGYTADLVSKLTGKNLPISSIRVRKFVSNTCFASNAHAIKGFSAPCSLREGLERTLEHEFINPDPRAEKFVTE